MLDRIVNARFALQLAQLARHTFMESASVSGDDHDPEWLDDLIQVASAEAELLQAVAVSWELTEIDVSPLDLNDLRTAVGPNLWPSPSWSALKKLAAHISHLAQVKVDSCLIAGEEFPEAPRDPDPPDDPGWKLAELFLSFQYFAETGEGQSSLAENKWIFLAAMRRLFSASCRFDSVQVIDSPENRPIKQLARVVRGLLNRASSAVVAFPHYSDPEFDVFARARYGKLLAAVGNRHYDMNLLFRGGRGEKLRRALEEKAGVRTSFDSVEDMIAHVRERNTPPITNPRPPAPDDLVTLEEIAGVIRRSTRTIHNWNSRSPWPTPFREGGGGLGHQFSWTAMKPWLEERLGGQSRLPERFPRTNGQE